MRPKITAVKSRRGTIFEGRYKAQRVYEERVTKKRERRNGKAQSKNKKKEKKAEVELGRAGRSKTTALLSFRLIIYVKILRKPYHKKKGISVTT